MSVLFNCIYYPLLIKVVIIFLVYLLVSSYIHEHAHKCIGQRTYKEYKQSHQDIPSCDFKCEWNVTYSLWYVYLQDHKNNNEEIKNIIKQNCKIGYLSELLLFIGVFCLSLKFKYNLIALGSIAYVFSLALDYAIKSFLNKYSYNKICVWLRKIINVSEVPFSDIRYFSILRNFKMKAQKLIIKKIFPKNIKSMKLFLIVWALTNNRKCPNNKIQLLD